VLDSVICCHQIQEDSASLQLRLKTAHDVGGQGSNLVTSAPGFSGN